MELGKYFDTTDGLGVLSTAGEDGAVNAAVYSKPRFFEDGKVAFIMRDRLTHANLAHNPHAHYLFRENGDGYHGVRLQLVKVAEECNTERLFALRKRQDRDAGRREDLFLVFFEVKQQLPLIGT